MKDLNLGTFGNFWYTWVNILIGLFIGQNWVIAIIITGGDYRHSPFNWRVHFCNALKPRMDDLDSDNFSEHSKLVIFEEPDEPSEQLEPCIICKQVISFYIGFFDWSYGPCDKVRYVLRTGLSPVWIVIDHTRIFFLRHLKQKKISKDIMRAIVQWCPPPKIIHPSNEKSNSAVVRVKHVKVNDLTSDLKLTNIPNIQNDF